MAFFGKLYGEENGREFVYRMEAKENLMTVQQYLKGIIIRTYHTEEDKIELLGNQVIDVSTLDPTFFYIQVAMVHPYSGEDGEKLTPFESHFGVSTLLLCAR